MGTNFVKFANKRRDVRIFNYVKANTKDLDNPDYLEIARLTIEGVCLEMDGKLDG